MSEPPKSPPSPPSIGVWARFFRVKLLPTAWLNATTGAVVAGGTELPAPDRLAAAAAALTALYLFGMGSNDWFDRRRDATIAPERPLPSGELSTRAAGTALIALLLIATAGLALLGAPAAIAGAAILVPILLYNRVLKDHPWLGPAAMGSVRLLVVLFGASLVAEDFDALLAPAVWLAAAALGGMSFWITRYSLEEETARAAVLGRRAGMIVGHVLLAAVATAILVPTVRILGWLVPLLALAQGLRQRSHFPPGWWTFRSLRTLLLLDGALLLSYNSPLAALIAGGLYLWTGGLLRRRR